MVQLVSPVFNEGFLLSGMRSWIPLVAQSGPVLKIVACVITVIVLIGLVVRSVIQRRVPTHPNSTPNETTPSMATPPVSAKKTAPVRTPEDDLADSAIALYEQISRRRRGNDDLKVDRKSSSEMDTLQKLVRLNQDQLNSVLDKVRAHPRVSTIGTAKGLIAADIRQLVIDEKARLGTS